MSRPLVLVTGASGKTAAPTTELMLAAGFPVRAMVRRIDERSQRLARKGAEVVEGDLFDPGSVREALAGVDRAYFTPPWHPHALEAAMIFADAARRTGLTGLVSLSQWLAAPNHPSMATRHMYWIEQLFGDLPGVAHVVVNPGYFADNYLSVVPLAAQLGVFPHPMADSRNAPPSNEDIARVVAGALTDPAAHAGRAYRPTGPELLSGHDMAAQMGSVLGREVRYLPMPASRFLKAAASLGLDPYIQANLGYYIEEHQAGTFEHGAPTDAVHALTGAPAEPFRETVRRYATGPSAVPSAKGRLTALSQFVRIGLTRPIDHAEFERSRQQSRPATPTLSIGDPGWLAAHTASGSRA